MSTEITVMQTMATAVTKSGMFGLKNENQALTLMLIADAEGIAPVQAIQMYSIINGMPSLKSTEVQSRFQRSGGKVEWLETTDLVAKAKLTHPEAGEYVAEFTIEQAVKMGIASKDNWVKMPKQMLMARCITSGIRALYPACLNNMYSVDEIIDNVIPDAVDAEVIEVSDPQKDHNANKRELSKQLTKLSFSKADVTSFAKEFDLGNEAELLQRIVSDKDLMLEYVNKFEEK